MSSMRITTRGLFRNYRSDLMANYKQLGDSMNRVQNQRAFNSYAEDPSAASRAFQLRRSFSRTDAQLTNTNFLISKYQSGWTALNSILSGSSDNDDGLSGIKDTLAGIHGTTGSGRVPLGQSLLSKAESILADMNVRYGSEFIFAGNDGLNVPFSFDENKTLLYRGIDVNTPVPDFFASDFDHDGNGQLNESEQAEFDAKVKEFNEKYSDYAKDTDGKDGVYGRGLKLYQMDHETTYIDIGLGITEDANGELITSSAYNSALPGVSILGYGVDEDGDPKNIVSLMQELGNIFYNCDPESGAFQNADDESRAMTLAQKLSSAVDNVMETSIDIAARSTYLEANVTQLEDTLYTLNTEIEDIEKLNPAIAISEMSWAQYTYNAALRIGTQLLSQSLIDYMT